MKSLSMMFKMSKLFFMKRYIDLIDISNSYTKVSNNYNNSFLNEMHNYNEEMLNELIKEYKKNSRDSKAKVLDLACGTGFNSKYIDKNILCDSFTLVDISKGMLKEAKRCNDFNGEFIEKDMLSYLRGCEDNSFDIVICAWAIKYQNPKKIINEISRVLKKDGYVAVIVNLKGTLPEVRKIYPKLLKEHYHEVNKIMLELPNPINKNTFDKWFTNKKFSKVKSISENHIFSFENIDELVRWVTSTGALAGFDTMINMENENVRETMIDLFEKNNISGITHKFVWGVYKNDK